MRCQEIHSWTFCGLVGAFLDLCLACLVLCGSTFAFFASKLLGIFGLDLPCPCNGLFGYLRGGKCLQRLLVDYPTRKISSVQTSAKNNFPFNSMWMKDQGYPLNVKLLEDTDRCNGRQEMEGEASCSCISDAQRSFHNSSVRDASPKREAGGLRLMSSAVPDGRADVKGKGVVNQRPRSGLRRRRRAVVEHRKSSPIPSSDPPGRIKRQASHSPCSMSESAHDICEEGPVPMNTAGIALHDAREGHTSSRLGEVSLRGFELNGAFDESMVMGKDATSAKEVVRNIQDEQWFDGNVKNVIRVLEQALEEEQAGRAALYLELEKERSAAATAADEAMAMILRLQKEKASIEMEARQYQRMIEEKSNYDAEEMDILKEIVVRREMEKHFLEKEVETYRQLILLNNESLEGDANDRQLILLNNESLEGDANDRQLILLNNESLEGDANDAVELSALKSTFSLDSSEDLVPMLWHISESIDQREIGKNVKTSSNFEVQTVEGPSYAHASVKEPPSSDLNKDADLKRVAFHRQEHSNKSHPHVLGSIDDNQEVQEKGMVSMDEERSVHQRRVQGLETESRLYKLNSPPKCNLLEKSIISLDEHGQKNYDRRCQALEMKADPNLSGTEINLPSDGEECKKCVENADQGGSDQQFSKVENKPSLYDIHVIDDGSNLCKEEGREESKAQLIDTASDRYMIHGLPFDSSGVSKVDAATDQPSASRAATEQDICRSCSDSTVELPQISNIHGKSLPIDLRRNSMSAVDSARLKLDTEVGWLRERLRIVQEGRQKLSFPVEHREKEKMQLQLLEDIAEQLKEIRQLTQPGKAVRQASLPPTSSKAGSKKRRCPSVSLGLHDST